MREAMRGRTVKLVLAPMAALTTAVVVVLFASQRMEGGDVSAALVAVTRPGWLALAGMALLVFLAADASSLALLARALEPRASALSAAGVVLESKMIEGATSFGGLELPYQIVRLRRAGLDAPQASSAVLVRALVHVSIIVCLGLVVLIPGVPSPITPLQRRLVLLLVGLVILAWGGLWATFGRSRGFKLLPQTLARRLDGFGAGLRILKGTGAVTVVAVVLLQALTWLATFALVPCILLALGWRGEVLPVLLGQALLPLFTSLSPLPGGAGMAELGYLQILGRALPTDIALFSLVLWRLGTWVLPTLVGVTVFGGRQLGRRAVPLNDISDHGVVIRPIR